MPRKVVRRQAGEITQCNIAYGVMLIVKLPLSPPKGDSKAQNGRFSSTIALLLMKVCYKVYSCENCQRQSCRAFIGLTIHAKIICGESPLLPKFFGSV